MTSQPRSRGARKIQRPVLLRRSQRLWVCPTKAPCASVVTVMATAATELPQSWRGFPQSLPLIVHNLIMFPVRGLSKSSAVRARQWPALGGPPRLLGNGHPRAPCGEGGVRSGAPGKREVALPGRGGEGAAATPAQGPQLCPRLPLPPVHPPWRPALGEAERKSRLFWMLQAGSATVISFMCHCWL